MARPKRKTRQRSSPVATSTSTATGNKDGAPVEENTASKQPSNSQTGHSGGSWAYRAWRSVFESSHRSSSEDDRAQQQHSSLSEQAPVQDTDQIPDENISSSQQAETDSEMTISTEDHSPQVDDNSLPLPITDQSANILDASTAAIVVRRDVSDSENSQTRSENTSVDDNGSASVRRTDKQVAASSGDKDELHRTSEKEVQLSRLEQSTLIEASTDKNSICNGEASLNGATGVEERIYAAAPSSSETNVATSSCIDKASDAVASANVLAAAGRIIDSLSAAANAKQSACSAATAKPMIFAQFYSGPIPPALGETFRPRLKDPPLSSISLRSATKSPPASGPLMSSGALASDDNEVICLGSSRPSDNMSMPEEDRKPAALPRKDSKTSPGTKSRSSGKRKRSPRSPTRSPYRVWTGLPRQIEFKSPSLSLPTSPSKAHAENLARQKEASALGTPHDKKSPKKRRGLIYKTCRDKFPRLDVGGIHRTIPVKDESYFAVNGQKKIFQIAILSKGSAMMLAQQSFQMRGEADTTMRDMRELAESIVVRCLGDGVNWEFFLPDSGAYIKRELEPMILLCEYMDECNFGRQISVRVVSEHSPAVVQLNYAPSSYYYF